MQNSECKMQNQFTCKSKKNQRQYRKYRKLFLILWCSREIADILESVFRTSLSENVVVFRSDRDTNSTHFLYICNWYVLYQSVAVYRCGALYRLLSLRVIPQPSDR